MVEWQPIETAPKNETILLLNEDNGVETGYWETSWSQNKWEAVGCCGGDFCMGHDVYNPTHWMPLPAPPKPSQINRGDVPQLEEV